MWIATDSNGFIIQRSVHLIRRMIWAFCCGVSPYLIFCSEIFKIFSFRIDSIYYNYIHGAEIAIPSEDWIKAHFPKIIRDDCEVIFFIIFAFF